MTEGSTDWVSAIAILAAGLILGTMLLYFLRRRSTAALSEDVELEDLEAKRDVLLQQLRELDDAQSKLAPAQAADERSRLELETAQVLRRIDEHRNVAAPKGRAAAGTTPPQAAAPAPASRSAVVGFAWGVGSVLVLVGLGWFVMNQAKARDEGASATGGTMGAQTGTMQAQQPQADPVVQQLEAAVRQSPDNFDARIELTKAYLERENLMGVFDQTQYVLSKSPNDSRALTYQALVRQAMGQTPAAIEMLQRATRSDPNFIDAWVALGWVNAQEGKITEAEGYINEAIKRHPEEKQRLEQVFAQMKQQASQPQPPAQQATGELPPGHPAIPAPGQAVDAAPNAPAGAAGAIHITLDIAPASKGKVTGSGVLYVIARPQGVMAGPPVAVKRLSAAQFPMTFDLSSADSMMGQPLPGVVRVEARLDSDGDAATRGPQDADAIADGVNAGSTIKLIMK